MARPRKELTPEDITQVERLAAVLNLEQIADYLGISDTTLRRRMQENPDVRTAYKKGRAVAAIGIGTSLLQQARDGNLTAMIFYAKTQMGWRETQQIEANVTNGKFIIDLVGDEDDSGS
jgi:IS30 family transposase